MPTKNKNNNNNKIKKRFTLKYSLTLFSLSHLKLKTFENVVKRSEFV